MVTRPLESIRDNIIEIVNQTIYLCTCWFLLHFNTQSEWSTFYEKLYILLIMAGPMISTMVILIDVTRKLIIKLRGTKKESREKIYAKPNLRSEYSKQFIFVSCLTSFTGGIRSNSGNSVSVVSGFNRSRVEESKIQNQVNSKFSRSPNRTITLFQQCGRLELNNRHIKNPTSYITY